MKFDDPERMTETWMERVREHAAQAGRMAGQAMRRAQTVQVYGVDGLVPRGEEAVVQAAAEAVARVVAYYFIRGPEVD